MTTVWVGGELDWLLGQEEVCPLILIKCGPAASKEPNMAFRLCPLIDGS